MRNMSDRIQQIMATKGTRVSPVSILCLTDIRVWLSPVNVSVPLAWEKELAAVLDGAEQFGVGPLIDYDHILC
jgi:hypothetical protein